MVSLTQRQALAATLAADPNLRKIQDLLDGKKSADCLSPSQDIRENLLDTIASCDSDRFKTLADEVGRRKIAADSDWCQDDFLVFLIILGSQKFCYPIPYLLKVIDARRRTPNSIPQKINEVFSSLVRQEFGIDGEFGFLKIPFLHLLGKLKIGRDEAEKAIKALSVAGLWDQLSPFFKLLSQKAYDLVLVARQPQVAETTDELIEGFKKHAKNLSMSQWWYVLLSLPGRLVLSIAGILVGFSLITVLFGLGKGFIDKEIEFNRTRPESIEIKTVSEANSNLPTEAEIIANGFLASGIATGNHLLNIAVECEPFNKPTPAFVVEVSHPEKRILNAFAFIQENEAGERPFTVIPLQKDSDRFRVMLPKQAAGKQLVIVLNFEVDQKESVAAVGSRVALRSLQ